MTKQSRDLTTPDQRLISDLYPIGEDPEVTKHIYRRARRERNEKGVMILPTALSTDERRMIDGRLRQIAPHLEAAKKGQVEKTVAEMLVGFGVIRAASDEEAAALIAKFTESLQDLPLYAIKRACLRFARGEVRKEEVGSRRDLDVGSPPTTPQLRIVAEAVARPHRDEATIASMLLRAEVTEDRDLSPEEVERRRELADKMRAEFKRQIQACGPTGQERMEEDRRTERLSQVNRRELIAEYESQGLEPQYADPECNVVVSLPMMLRNGWRIERVEGRAALMRGDEIR